MENKKFKVLKNYKVINKKTSKEYFMITDNAICTTNEHAGVRLVIYKDEKEQYFAREYYEFYQEFVFGSGYQYMPKTQAFISKKYTEMEEEENKFLDGFAKQNKKYLGKCLDEAKTVITGERQDSYGQPEDSFRIIAAFWSIYLRFKFDIDITLGSLDTAHMMSLFKHARMIGQKATRDGYIDACGYLAIAADRLMEAK